MHRFLSFGVLLMSLILTQRASAQQLGPDHAHPLCEASAAVVVGCPSSDGGCLLVGDNEVRDGLFLFDADRLEIPRFLEMEEAVRDHEQEISDIEALTQLASGRVLVMGSHSRNSSCEARSNRRRFVQGRIASDRFERDGELVQSRRLTCERLFGSTPDDPVPRTVCDRIDEAEQAAEAAAGGTRAQCEATEAFNAEGVVAIGRSDGEEVWVGLRAPLVRASPSDASGLSILLRMTGLDQFRFDAAALVDLEGWGIRDLAVQGGWVWGLGGPSADSTARFTLWRFPVEDLRPGTTIVPEILRRDLPTSSEGLTIGDSRAHVIIDGDAGDDDHRCEIPARHVTIDLAPSKP